MPANKWLKRGALGAGGAGLGAGGFYLGRQQGRHDEAKRGLADAQRNYRLQHALQSSALRDEQTHDEEIEGLRRKASKQARKPGNAYWATSTKLDDAYMLRDALRRQSQHQGGRTTEAGAQRFYNTTRERQTRPFWANQGLSKGYPMPGGDYPDTDKDFDYPGRKARAAQMKAKRIAAQQRHAQSSHAQGERTWLKQQAVARKGLHLARRDDVQAFSAKARQRASALRNQVLERTDPGGFSRNENYRMRMARGADASEAANAPFGRYAEVKAARKARGLPQTHQEALVRGRAKRRGEHQKSIVEGRMPPTPSFLQHKPDTVLDAMHRQPRQVRKALDERQQRQAGIALGGAGLLGTGAGLTAANASGRYLRHFEHKADSTKRGYNAALATAQDKQKRLRDFIEANKDVKATQDAANRAAGKPPNPLPQMYRDEAKAVDDLKSAAGRAKAAARSLERKAPGLRRARTAGRVGAGVGAAAALSGAALYAHANHQFKQHHSVRKADKAHAFDVDTSHIPGERAAHAAHQVKSQSLYGLPPEAADKLDPRTKRFLANRATYGMSEPGVKNKARSAGAIGGGLLAGSVAGRFAGNLATMKLKNKRVRGALATGAATLGGGIGTSVGARKAVQMNDKIAAREHAQEALLHKAEAQNRGEKGYRYASPFRRNWSTPRQQRQEIRRPSKEQAIKLGAGTAGLGAAGLGGGLLYHRSAGKSYESGMKAKREAEEYIANARRPYNEYRARQLKRTGSTGNTKHGEHIRQAGENLINPPRGAKNVDMYPQARLRSAEKQIARAEARMGHAGKVGAGSAVLAGAAGYALLRRSKNRVKAQQQAHAAQAVSRRRAKQAGVSKAEERDYRPVAGGALIATGAPLAYASGKRAGRAREYQARVRHWQRAKNSKWAAGESAEQTARMHGAVDRMSNRLKSHGAKHKKAAIGLGAAAAASGLAGGGLLAHQQMSKAEDRRQKAYQLGAAGALGAGGLTATGGGLAAYKAAHHAARQQHHQSRQAFHALKPSLETVKLEPLELDKVKLAGGEHFETKVAQHGRKAAAHGLKRGRATKAAVGLGLGTAGAAATSAYLANKSRKANSLSKQLDGPWGSGAVMGRGD